MIMFPIGAGKKRKKRMIRKEFNPIYFIMESPRVNSKV